MDRVFHHFGADPPEPREVVFTNIVSEFLKGADLRDKLHGFEEVEVEIPDDNPHSGETVTELVGEWDPVRGVNS